VQEGRVDGAQSVGSRRTPSLVAIGNFDGVHAGHRAVLTGAAADARSKHLAPLALTFDPHPAEVLGRGRQPVLTPIDRKVELLRRVDPSVTVVVEPFTLELAGMTPRAFAEKLLVSALDARIVVVGQNFRFGHAREGDLKMLAELGTELGFEARVEPLVGDAGGTFSSSRIRKAIASADLAEAERLLGRPHALSGTVVRGDGRGRTIGVPTANLGGVAEALPPFGVYACLVDRKNDEDRPERLGTGVLNVGNRPTVGAGFSVEVHLHDFDQDVYGAGLRIHLVERLRDERKFPGLDALVAQIRSDVDAARKAVQGRVPDPAAGGAWY
jgi:riboflavin kinase / FMN adenylyltransferase